MTNRPQPTLSGLFRSPCGVWVSPHRMRSGFVWFAPLRGVTRTSVLGLWK